MQNIAAHLGVNLTPVKADGSCAAFAVHLLDPPTMTSLRLVGGKLYLSTYSADGGVAPQVLAVRRAVEVLGAFADQIIGDWHIKHDYNRSTGDHDPQILNIDDFPNNSSLREVVAKHLSYAL